MHAQCSQEPTTVSHDVNDFEEDTPLQAICIAIVQLSGTPGLGPTIARSRQASMSVFLSWQVDLLGGARNSRIVCVIICSFVKRLVAVPM